MLLREQLVSDFSGTVLENVRDNGWLTEISDAVGINRKYFNRKGLAGMKLRCVLRILAGLAWKMTWTEFSYVWMELGRQIYDMGDQQFYEMCDERK